MVESQASTNRTAVPSGYVDHLSTFRSLDMEGPPASTWRNRRWRAGGRFPLVQLTLRLQGKAVKGPLENFLRADRRGLASPPLVVEGVIYLCLYNIVNLPRSLREDGPRPPMAIGGGG